MSSVRVRPVVVLCVKTVEDRGGEGRETGNRATGGRKEKKRQNRAWRNAPVASPLGLVNG